MIMLSLHLNTEFKNKEIMCEALELKKKCENEGYDTSYWLIFCGYDVAYGEHGFIFSDGSIIDIGIGEDHRIISMDKWMELGLITYTAIHGEADFRIHGLITYKQAKTMCEIITRGDIDRVFIDVYKEALPNYYMKDILIGTIELEPYKCEAYYVKDIIERILNRD